MHKNMCLVIINMLFIMSMWSILQNLCFKPHNQTLYLPVKSIVSKKHMALFTNTTLSRYVMVHINVTICDIAVGVTTGEMWRYFTIVSQVVTSHILTWCDITNYNKHYNVKNYNKQISYILISNFSLTLCWIHKRP